MAYEKTILCLACSRKLSGRCVAGKEVTQDGFGEWIRPVSDRESREISYEERRYEGGGAANILDMIRVPLKRRVPMGHQTENYVIESKSSWILHGRATWDAVKHALDPVKGSIWKDGYSSSHGENDRVPEDLAKKCTYSLSLVEVPKVRIDVGLEGPKRKVRATFKYAGVVYSFVVTDLEFESEYKRKGEGRYSIEDAILCISLGEPFGGYAYKLVATVFTEERCKQLL